MAKLRARAGALAAGIAVLVSGTVTAEAQPSLRTLIKDLRRTDARGTAALEALIQRGPDAKKALLREARHGGNLVSRGRSVAALTAIGGDDVREAFKTLKGPGLFNQWVNAGRITLAPDLESLLVLAPLANSSAGLDRPFKLRAEALIGQEKDLTLKQIFALSKQHTSLRSALAPRIKTFGENDLVAVMVTSGDNDIRRQAAGYLAAFANQGRSTEVAKATIGAVVFVPNKERVPWAGGALFIPSISWDRAEAKALAGHLVAWHLWADLKNQKALQTQIHNNLRSLNLARAAGYQSPGWSNAGTVRWLQVWKKVVGNAGIKAMLDEQGATAPKYLGVLDAQK